MEEEGEEGEDVHEVQLGDAAREGRAIGREKVDGLRDQHTRSANLLQPRRSEPRVEHAERSLVSSGRLVAGVKALS